MTFSNIFEVTDFSYDPQTRGGHFQADISLCQATNHLEIDTNILDLDSKTVVAQVPMVQNSHSTQLVLQQDFTLENNVSDHFGVITYGKWGDETSTENELTIFREANNLDTGFNYEHIWRKKRSRG